MRYTAPLHELRASRGAASVMAREKSVRLLRTAIVVIGLCAAASCSSKTSAPRWFFRTGIIDQPCPGPCRPE